VGANSTKRSPEVPGISVGFMRLDVANSAKHILELALNEEVGLH
jgi:hypothetical protein